MAGFRIEGNVSGNVVEVNSNNELKTTLTNTIENSGFASIGIECDNGEVTGNRLIRSPEISQDFKIRVGQDTLVFNQYFQGGALNTSVWTAPTTTMTIAVSSGVLSLNSNLSTSNNSVARLTSYRTFPIFGPQSTNIEIGLQFTQDPVFGNTCEWGVGFASTTADPTDGVYFRLNSDGQFKAVININGVENESSDLDFNTLVGPDKSCVFLIYVGNKTADFWINDTLVASINAPNAASNITGSMSLPIFVRTFNSTATSEAQVIKIGYCSVQFSDGSYSKDFAHIASGSGWHCSLAQTGTTAGQTTVWTNSANPTTATPTNTTAGLTTGLGGIFIANINGLSTTTDYIIQSYQVPTGSATVPGRNLYVTGIRVSAVNTTVANGAGPTTWAVALAYGSTTVSLATSETTLTRAPRRIPLGVQSISTNAPVGEVASNSININFSTPIFVDQGSYVQTIIRFISNNSTSTETLNFYIGFEGYFE